jgi:enamine deaminase RidA (YjgF/YER057c/UK114 family)
MTIFQGQAHGQEIYQSARHETAGNVHAGYRSARRQHCFYQLISGQVSADANGKVVGAGDIEAQAVQVFENLKLALGGIGATFDDVIKFTIFIVDFTQERRKAVMDVRSRYISSENPPAATMVGVDQLVEPELLVEIEAVVAID